MIGDEILDAIPEVVEDTGLLPDQVYHDHQLVRMAVELCPPLTVYHDVKLVLKGEPGRSPTVRKVPTGTSRRYSMQGDRRIPQSYHAKVTNGPGSSAASPLVEAVALRCPGSACRRFLGVLDTEVGSSVMG